MIIVKIELHSAITKQVTELGRMHICNENTSGCKERGNYVVRVLRKGTTDKIQRIGRVDGYPRLAYNVWRLVARACKAAFPEEA